MHLSPSNLFFHHNLCRWMESTWRCLGTEFGWFPLPKLLGETWVMLHPHDHVIPVIRFMFWHPKRGRGRLTYLRWIRIEEFSMNWSWPCSTLPYFMSIHESHLEKYCAWSTHAMPHFLAFCSHISMCLLTIKEREEKQIKLSCLLFTITLPCSCNSF